VQPTRLVHSRGKDGKLAGMDFKSFVDGGAYMAERGVDVSSRTVLRWGQTFGPLLAAEARKRRRRPGGKWYCGRRLLRAQEREALLVPGR
jgi:hypothetical protein